MAAALLTLALLAAGAVAPQAPQAQSLGAATVATELGDPPPAATLLATGRSHLAAGDYPAALDVLRQLRLRYRNSPLIGDALLLAADAAHAMDSPYQERFLLSQALELGAGDGIPLPAATRFATAHRLAELLAEQRDHARALRYYDQAIGLLAGRAVAGSPAQLAGLRLTAARLAHFHDAGDRLDALRHFDAIDFVRLDDAEAVDYRELARSLMWDYLDAARLGIADGNISSVAADGDDIWVGSWTGGLARFSHPTSTRTVFTTGRDSVAANTVRHIERIGAHVWVGTLQGLSVYSKASSRWRTVAPFAGAITSEQVSAVAHAKGTIFVGTAGRGLWRRAGDRWVQVIDGVLPGRFINTLEVVEGTLFIGTLDLGLVSLDLESGALRAAELGSGVLGGQNITDLVASTDGSLWIATFGAGLFRWDRVTNRVHRYTVESGHLPDNWVLSGAEGDRGVYFGTFGGGAVRFSAGGRAGDGESWTRIGLEQGLPSLDVSVVAFARPNVYFGTLGAGVAVLSETRSAHTL